MIWVLASDRLVRSAHVITGGAVALGPEEPPHPARSPSSDATRMAPGSPIPRPQKRLPQGAEWVLIKVLSQFRDPNGAAPQLARRVSTACPGCAQDVLSTTCREIATVCQ